MNDSLKKHLEGYLSKGLRFDGRKCEEYREIKVEQGITGTAEGSARVKMGDTEVTAGVKLMVDKPYPDTPEDGALMVGAEFMPLASPDFESGPPGIQSIELARVVDRGIRESKAIDTKKLCIKAGEKVWLVSVDICILNDDGNLFDAAALATVAALLDTKFPSFDGTTIDYKKLTDKKLPLKKLPVSVTVLKIGNSFIVDPSLDEESVADARLTVASTPDEELCALQKGGNSPLKMEDIDAMINLGVSKGKEIRKCL